jgi:cell fate regulator YaaT (PSP1 superfamily)
MGTIKEYDCQRGCEKEIKETGEIKCTYKRGCCKLGVFNWLEGISQEEMKDLFEVRFKNTRKLIFRNTSEQNLKIGDIVVVEAQNGYDVGIITLAGAIIANQLKRDRIDPTTYEFRKIDRKARPADIQKWQEAIAREHRTMIRSRQMAADLQLNMKIGDVEFQGDGTKAIFYYIADERVDFRQLIKDFAEEFRIRIEMKQIGARQEAGLIGGLGVCGQALCCSRYMNNFQSITTQAARCQDLSLNPQKLAGQCGKLKCCINYEASVYVDAQSKLPKVSEPLHFEDGDAFLMKTDILKGMMWFSYDPKSMANMIQLTAEEVKEVIAMNRKGEKAPTCMQNNLAEKQSEFMSAVGEESISRFDSDKKKKKNRSSDRERRKDKGERSERQERAERHEKPERGEKPERSEKGEHNGRQQRKEEPQAPAAQQTPEGGNERPERKEKGERGERGERGDRNRRHHHGHRNNRDRREKKQEGGNEA